MNEYETEDDDWIIEDPIESDPAYADILAEAEAAARENMGIIGLTEQSMGACHFIWGGKKQYLKEKYGIDWKSPAELNPGCCFD